MQITAEHWQTFAAMIAILGILSAGAVSVRRLFFPRPSTRPPAPTPAAPNEIAERLERHAERLTKLEAAVVGLASRDDIHKLQIAIERQGGDMRKLQTAIEHDAKAVDQLSSAITRIEDHLLGEKR